MSKKCIRMSVKNESFIVLQDRQMTVAKWVGPHQCINGNLTQDHANLTSQIISNEILGIM